AALVAGSVVGYRRINPGGDGPGESAMNGGEDVTNGDGPTPAGVGRAGRGPEADDDGVDASDEEDADDDGEDLSLLSDEERVERL
ncbi:hypothetical protein EXE43_27660, partial [Halorubrum sp. SS5]